MKYFNIRVGKLGRGARERAVRENCCSCQPGLLKVAIMLQGFVLFAVFPHCSLPWIWLPGLHERLPVHPIPPAPTARLVSSDRLSSSFRLCWFCHGLRNSGAKAVPSRLQAVPARHTGPCQGLPFPVDCHCLSSLWGAAPIPALRGSPGAATSSCRKTRADWGTLTCLDQTFTDHIHQPLKPASNSASSNVPRKTLVLDAVLLPGSNPQNWTIWRL